MSEALQSFRVSGLRTPSTAGFQLVQRRIPEKCGPPLMPRGSSASPRSWRFVALSSDHKDHSGRRQKLQAPYESGQRLHMPTMECSCSGATATGMHTVRANCSPHSLGQPDFTERPARQRKLLLSRWAIASIGTKSILRPAGQHPPDRPGEPGGSGESQRVGVKSTISGGGHVANRRRARTTG